MEEPQLYTEIRRNPDGTETVIGYAYGAPWVQQALYMNDLRFDTEEEAKAWWQKNHG